MVRAVDLLAYTLLAGSVLVGLLLWPSLPDQMAIHFGTSGQPDDFVPKSLGIVLAPAIGLGAILLTRYAPEWASRQYRTPEIENLTVGFVAGVVAYLQGFVYAWNLGYQLDPMIVVAPVLLAAGGLVVYAYARPGLAG